MESTNNEAIEPTGPVCPSCGTAVGTADKFCGHCGTPIVNDSSTVHKDDVFDLLRPFLLYYFITLALLAIFKFTDLFPDDFEGMAVISVIDILVVLVFWAMHFSEVKPLFSLAPVKVHILLLTILGAAVGGLFIHYTADFIQVSISDDVFYNTYLFQDTSWPLLMSVLFICVQPALFEEVAFRGFLFNNLQKLTPGMGAVYISSFIFGIIHLAVISLLWLVPIGLAFAWLRLRYNTLWYGMVGHFVYNLTITLLEFNNV